MTFHIPTPPAPVALAALDRASLTALRRALSARIDADLALLDAIDGDPDFEATGDDEPSLCGIGHLDARGWVPSGGGDDREAEDEHDEDGADREPSLAAPEACGFGVVLHRRVECPRFGVRWIPCGHGGDQTRWAEGSRDDREPDAGDEPEEENEHGGNILDEPHDAESDGCLAEDFGPRMRRDPASQAAACEARSDLRRIQDRRAGRETRGELRLVPAHLLAGLY